MSFVCCNPIGGKSWKLPGLVQYSVRVCRSAPVCRDFHDDVGSGNHLVPAWYSWPHHNVLIESPDCPRSFETLRDHNADLEDPGT